MSEGKNLSLQRCSRLKGLPSRRKQRENDREHVTEKPQRRLPKLNQFLCPVPSSCYRVGGTPGIFGLGGCGVLGRGLIG